MISKGQTIVYKVSESHYMFYWLCDIQDEYLVFFNWYGNPYKATSTDFWKISNKWFNEKLEEGKLEVYDSLPLEKYGDIFEQQAVLMNNK